MRIWGVWGFREDIKEMTRKKSNEKGRDDKVRRRSGRGQRRSGGCARGFYTLLMLVAVAVLGFSLYQIGITLLPYHQGRIINQQIAEAHTAIEVIEDEEVGENNSGTIPERDRIRFRVDFDGLLAINSDTVAWIRFEEPEIINYPVVRSHDNFEYLHRGFDGSESRLGSIFLDMDNSTDFSDRHTIIYGHNMAVGGEMFSQLVEFQDPDFIERNPYFFIHTPDGMMRTYRIFMAAVVGDNSLIYRVQFHDDEDFLEFLQLSRNISIYTIDGDDLNEEARIVTLSTCTNVVMTDRFIIQGVLVEERMQ